VKSYLKSKTMMGAFVTVVGAVGALITSPIFHTQAAECLGIFGQSSLAQTLTTLSPIILTLGGGLVTAYGRTQAKTQIYTPKGLPGNDKPQEPPETW
jgi:arginine exporter protein ArgO